MATQQLKSFEKRWDRFMLKEKLEMLEEFDTIFRQRLGGENHDLYKEAIDWCSKKRIELSKELIR